MSQGLKQRSVWILLASLVFVISLFTLESVGSQFFTPQYLTKSWQRPQQSNSGVQDDSQLVAAVQNRRDVDFLQAAKVIVTRILPDDTQGLQHQRWYVKLSSGASVFAVYNIDLSKRVPLEVNQSMSMGGQFKMTNQGPLIHWLHEDPKHRRPDGYVDVNGQRYGKISN